MKNIFNFFKGNRHVFLDLEMDGEASLNNEGVEAEAGSDNETKNRLEDLRRNVGSGEPLAYRDMEMPEEYQDKGILFSQEDLDRLATSKELMESAEVESMQKAQEAIFRDYISPVTVLALRENPNNQPIFDKYLKAAMKYPFELKYEGTGEGIVIKKRPKSQIPDNELPNDLTIRVSEQGQVRAVQTVEISAESKAEYDRISKEEDFPQFMNSLLNTVRDIKIRFNIPMNAPFPPQAIPLILQLAYKSVSSRLKMLYEIHNMIVPRRLIECIQVRNFSNQGFDPVNEGAYQNFVEAMSKEAKTYDELVGSMIKNGEPDKWQISTTTDGQLYHFTMMIGGEPLIISREGYIQKVKTVTTTYKDAQGTDQDKVDYVVVEREKEEIGNYQDKLKRLYCEQNPTAPACVTKQ
jgi:hypothetical protein